MYLRLTVSNCGDFSDVGKNTVLAVIFKDEELYEEVAKLTQLARVETIVHVGDKVLEACHNTVQTLTESNRAGL